MADTCLIESCFAMSTIKLMIFVGAEKVGHRGVVKDGEPCRCAAICKYPFAFYTSGDNMMKRTRRIYS